MKKIIMIISIISLSLLLSDLSFAKKKKHRRKFLQRTEQGAERVGRATTRGAAGIVKSSGNAVSGILNAL